MALTLTLYPKLFYSDRVKLTFGDDPLLGITLYDNCQELYLQALSPNGGTAGVRFAIVVAAGEPPNRISKADFDALNVLKRVITLFPGDPMVRIDVSQASNRPGGGEVDVPPWGIVPGTTVFMQQAAVDAQNIFGYVHQRFGIKV